MTDDPRVEIVAKWLADFVDCIGSWRRADASERTYLREQARDILVRMDRVTNREILGGVIPPFSG